MPPAARELVLQWVQAWRGEDYGLGAAWVEALLAGLDESDAAAARLCRLGHLRGRLEDRRLAGRRLGPAGNDLSTERGPRHR